MEKRFKFGDLILNEYAGEMNPYKYGMFIKEGERTIQILHKDGHISKYDIVDQRKHSFLVKVGTIGMAVWDAKTAKGAWKEEKNNENT